METKKPNKQSDRSPLVMDQPQNVLFCFVQELLWESSLMGLQNTCQERRKRCRNLRQDGKTGREKRPDKSQSAQRPGETDAVRRAERRRRPGRPCSPRSQEVINPSQTLRNDVHMHGRERLGVCWEANWWEWSVGSQSLSPYPEALPKSGVITP